MTNEDPRRDPGAPKSAGIIAPTVGRQVWYWNIGNDLVDGDAAPQPEAATVVYVHDDRLVNLQVLDEWGNARGLQGIRLKQPDDNNCTRPYCEWMPYQKGQAQKTEKLEQQLARQDER